VDNYPDQDGYIIYRGYKLAYYQAARQRLILNDQVQAAYWSQIAPVAIGYGSELLRLFFIAANDSTTVTANQSWWSRWWSTLTAGSNNQPVEVLPNKPIETINYQSAANQTTTSLIKTSLTGSSSIGAVVSTSAILKKVIDGDTIELSDGQKVRYLGVDAPEIASAVGATDQCLAQQAKQRNQALLAGGHLQLVADSGGDKDVYGRLLRYVYSGNVFINQQLAAEGLAQVFFCAANQVNCPPANDQLRRQQITLAGQAAKQNQLGLYSSQCIVVQASSSAKTITSSNSSIKAVIPTKTNTSTKVGESTGTTTSSTKIIPFVSSSSSIVSTSQALVADLIPPNTTINTDLPTAINTGTARFLLSSNESGQFECRLNDKDWKTCPADYQLKNLVSGDYLFLARAIDLAGNIDPTPATYSWLIDKKKPSISWLAKPSSTMVDQVAEFSVEASEEVSFFCQLDSQAEQVCQDNFSYDQLLVGQHQVTVRARDLAGNYSAKLTYKWTIIGGLPERLSIDYPPANPWLASSTSLTISGQADNASRVLVGTQVAQLLADNTWRATVHLVAGINNFIIWPENEIDQRGPSTTLSIILDNIKPSSSVSILPETVNELGFVVEWHGFDSGDAASGQLVYDIQYRLGSDSWQPWLSAVNYTSAIFDQTVEIDQKISFRCRARDKAGNWENWPANSVADTRTQLIDVPSGPPPKIVISQFVTRGPAGASDEFVELYNPNDEAVDLTGWLVQSKSAAGITWINRLGEGLPAGSIIAARGYFLLASADYSDLLVPDYRHDSNWGLSDDGGHLRLVDSQEQILDKVGYNQADDPEGQPTSGDLAAEHSLQRKANAASTAVSLALGGAEANLGNGWDSDNNQADFVDQVEVRPRSGNNQTVNQDLLSIGLRHLWHFDECLGSTLQDAVGSADIINQPFIWQVGYFNCAGYQTWERPAVSVNLSQPLDPAQVTLAYWWRNASSPNEGRGHEYLVSADGQIVLGLTPSASGGMQFWHYGLNYRLSDLMPVDDDWHLLVATQEQNQLKFYVDDRLKFQTTAEYSPPQPITRLDLADENWPIVRDELAIWQRALSLAEIRQLYQLAQPLSPRLDRPAQAEPIAVYQWNFDEGVSNIAVDNLQQVQLTPINRWIYSPFNLGVRIEHPGDLLANLPQAVANQDVTLSFWWRNIAYPNESRANIILHNASGGALFGLAVGTYGLKVNYNGASWYPLDLSVNDNEWHQAILVYDSYAYHLSLYLDGQRRWQGEQIWLSEPLAKVSATQDNWPIDLDELTIWQGALSDAQVETSYELARPNLDE
jgi:endonuclease YncB( thermonuclease family)